MELLSFDASTCQRFSAAVEKEWLETNGIGGFASSTIIGANTRRYHGLLTAALNPPLGRFLLLSKIEEALEIEGKTYPLSCNIYFNAVHPDGFSRLERFSLEPYPVFAYRASNVVVKKSIIMIHGENTTIIEYAFEGLRGGDNVRFSLKPLIAFRDYHSMTHANDRLERGYQGRPGVLVIRPYPGVPALFIHHPPCSLIHTGYWYRNFEYPNEARRGLDYREDLFNPFELACTPKQGEAIRIVATIEDCDTYPVEERMAQEKTRRAGLLKAWNEEERESCRAMLLLAADSFIVKKGTRGSGHSIIAGYPWFGDWGRDTLIALPGLTLCTGRSDLARDILETFSRRIKDGLVPNLFAETSGEAMYNSVDASLWFINAVHEYAKRTNDYDTVKSWFMDPLRRIIASYRKGTRFNIRMDEDGLIDAGEPGVQLTWMDAKVDDWVVTQRQGKPVEVNALWYNAIRIMETFAERFGLEVEASTYRGLSQLVFESFNRQFFNETLGGLYDVLTGPHRDASVRPNQVFAISLPFPVLKREHWASTLEVVEHHLLTPYGLRSLSASDPNFRGKYEGNPSSRDSAYHQGTVWPWLIGPYLTAKFRVDDGETKQLKREIREKLQPLLDHLEEAGLGSVSEIYDGDSPHRPKGCISQAWSVAEIIRVFHDHLGLNCAKGQGS